MNKKISIITPAYNAEKYIERCLKSIQNQTYPNIEHLVIDDGSTDHTYEKCLKYASKIRLISKKNAGVSAARNIGLQNATGSYILFVDADDWLEENMCQELVNAIEKDGSDIALCGYNYFYENSNHFESIALKEFPNNQNFLELITTAKTNCGGFPWNKLIKKEIITHPFDENIHYYENLLFFLQNCSPNTKFSIVKECLYNYCINDTSALHTKKYSLKKLTTLVALEKCLPYLPHSSLREHQIYYLNNYFDNLYYLKKSKQVSKIKMHIPVMQKCYHDIIFKSNLPLKIKFKLFCKRRLNFIYCYYKRKEH